MRIAMFGHKRIPSREGGVEVVVETLSACMAKLGHEVVCYNRGGHHVSGAEFDTAAASHNQGVRLKTVPTVDKKGLAAVTSSFFAALCAGFSRAEVVHIHAEGPAFMCWIPKLLGKRVVVTVHGLDWQRQKWQGGLGSWYIRMGEKMTARFADRIIVLSQNIQNYFRSTYGRETVWIPNGICQAEPVPAQLIRKKFGLGPDSYLLFLGRLVPEKGVHHLIEAFREIRTDKKLVIAGGSSDSAEYVEKLHLLARGDDRIVFTGYVRGQILEELHSNAYVYILPSQVEGMPLSLLEAISYGSCCLVSDIPECTEVVGDGAAVFPAGDASGLRACLQRLCDDPTLVAAYRQKIRSILSGRDSWETVTEKTLMVYQ